MGVDTKLYLNTRWDLGDIVDVIQRVRGEKISIESNHSFAPGYFCFMLEKRMIHVHTLNQTPIGTATLLSMNADDESHKLFKDIANVLGGIFMDNDVDGKCEFIMGNMWEEDGLAYFLKHAIICDGIELDDIEALEKSKKAWHEKYRS